MPTLVDVRMVAPALALNATPSCLCFLRAALSETTDAVVEALEEVGSLVLDESIPDAETAPGHFCSAAQDGHGAPGIPHAA